MNNPNGTSPEQKLSTNVAHSSPAGRRGRTASGTDLIRSGPVLAAHLPKRGKHRRENVLASIAAAKSSDEPVTVNELLARFGAVA